MADVERFITIDTYPPQPNPDGQWVRYSDYEKLRHERDSLRSQVEAEAKRMRSEAGDWQLNEGAQQQAEIDANRLQAILDSQGQR